MCNIYICMYTIFSELVDVDSIPAAWLVHHKASRPSKVETSSTLRCLIGQPCWTLGCDGTDWLSDQGIAW